MSLLTNHRAGFRIYYIQMQEFLTTLDLETTQVHNEWTVMRTGISEQTKVSPSSTPCRHAIHMQVQHSDSLFQTRFPPDTLFAADPCAEMASGYDPMMISASQDQIPACHCIRADEPSSHYGQIPGSALCSLTIQHAGTDDPTCLPWLST